MMQLHLKKGEKVYINGAVVKAEQRCTIELLNNVTFLLEAHIMQADQAVTPVKQLYFVVQTMLIEPDNAGLTRELYWHQSQCLAAAVTSHDLLRGIQAADSCIKNQRYFDALKIIRKLIPIETELMFGEQRKEVA
jgi:flagellar biosynthesis repressor protein FlbT